MSSCTANTIIHGGIRSTIPARINFIGKISVLANILYLVSSGMPMGVQKCFRFLAVFASTE